MLHTDSSREVTGPLEDTPRLRTLPLSEARLGQNFPSLCTKVQCQWLVCTQNPQRDTTLNQVQIIHFTHCSLLCIIFLLKIITYDSTEEPELPVHQVPDPLECSLLAVEHQDPGGVLGGAGDHQHVAVNVEVGLTLGVIIS